LSTSSLSQGMKHQEIVFVLGIRAVVKNPSVGLRWGDGKLHRVARGRLTEAGARTYADTQHPPPTNKDSSMHTLFFSAESVEGSYERLPCAVCPCWLRSYDEFVGSLATLVEEGWAIAQCSDY